MSDTPTINKRASAEETAHRLEAAASGDRGAAAELMPLVYDELRGLAAAYLRHERPNHTLQPTAVVNEAFLRMVDQRKTDWKSRAHFMAVGASMIRRVLIDHARATNAAKRGGSWTRVALDQPLAGAQDHVEVIALDDALRKLEGVDHRQARVVELRFFGGLGTQEVAHLLEVSPRTVESDWAMAKAWLRRELSREMSAGENGRQPRGGGDGGR
jgi:RNA polymerase sigma-70 factor, ECF subfamily